MMTNAMIMPTLPVADMARARKFYEEKLGLRFREEREAGALYDAGGGTMLLLYQRAPTKADNTAAAFLVDDIKTEIAELKQKGITFEEYDMPGLKTEGGIATTGQDKIAWFKDTEGNILAMSQIAARPEQERREAEARAAPPAR
ncbi:VOC family protein [Methanoculleus sp. FWC-SCC1]|uniref:VOC family protein n=1 Tax=Methanoculleus frigidifontis TaxID=2584085 RepID=A0ABT8M8I8_9EURY|nr:VOC family protein [Methanoculleus sp. FWC-SCC1]MDN7024247.1 VOC family protein [Methanoculleus sp. FWC-SCC1]